MHLHEAVTVIEGLAAVLLLQLLTQVLLTKSDTSYKEMHMVNVERKPT